jgi:hypothetical protein
MGRWELHTSFYRKAEVKRLFRRFVRRWESNIIMDLGKAGRGDVHIN